MITKEDAGSHSRFYHVILRNADGSAVRCHANGRLKTWKRNQSRWSLPVKQGWKGYFYLCPSNAHFYLCPSNAHQWLTYDPTEWWMRSKSIRRKLKVSDDIPDQILLDMAKEKGLLPQDYRIPGR